MKRMEEKGFSPAAVSRMLGLSRATFSKTLKGNQNPRPVTLQAFRRIVEDHCGEHPRDTSLRKNDVHENLNFLEKHAPQSYAAVKATINALMESAVNASPKTAEVSPEVATALGAAEAAKKLAQELPPTQTTPAPNARKRRRGGDAPPGKK